MHTFIDHVHHLRLEEQLSVLGENVYELNHEAYDQLFATELKRLAMQTNDRMAKAQLEDLADDFKFTRYILKSVRSAGFKDDQQANQITHDIVSQLLLGSLFEFDPATIPFGKRFSVSVANAIRNVVAKQNNRQTVDTIDPDLRRRGRRNSIESDCWKECWDGRSGRHQMSSPSLFIRKTWFVGIGCIEVEAGRR